MVVCVGFVPCGVYIGKGYCPSKNQSVDSDYVLGGAEPWSSSCVGVEWRVNFPQRLVSAAEGNELYTPQLSVATMVGFRRGT